MKLYIDVKDETERDLIATALCDPQVRALVKVMGALLPFSKEQQQRILERVAQRYGDV